MIARPWSVFRLGGIDQDLKSSIRLVHQGVAFAEQYGKSEHSCHTCHLVAFAEALVSGVAVNHYLVDRQQVIGRCQDVHVEVVTNTEWNKPEALSKPACIYVPWTKLSSPWW